MSEETIDYAHFENYPKFVTRLGSAFSMISFVAKTGTMGLGLAGEAAEVSELAIKYNGVKGEIDEADRLKLIDELGDICWYVAFAAANVVDVPFVDLIPQGVPNILETRPAESLKFLSLQLSTQCGAVADIAKKLVYHGKPYNDEVKAKLVLKLTDVMHNVLFIVKDVCRSSLEEVIKRNVEKLSTRYASLTFTTAEFMEKEEGKRV